MSKTTTIRRAALLGATLAALTATSAGAAVLTPSHEVGASDTPVSELPDGAGGAWLVSTHSLGGGSHSLLARRRPRGGGLGPAITIASGHIIPEPAGVDAHGTLTTSWADDDGVHVRDVAPSGELGPDTVLVAGTDTDGGSGVAVAPSGAAVTGWDDLSTYVLHIAVRPPGAGFAAPVTIPDPTASAGIAKLLVTDDGTAYVLYVRNASTINEHPRLWMAKVQPGKAALTTLVSYPDASDHDVGAVDATLTADGRVHVIWFEQAGSPVHRVAKVATFDSDMNLLGSRAVVSAAGDDLDSLPSAAAGPGAKWVVGWAESAGGGPSQVHARVYDGVAPGPIETVGPAGSESPVVSWGPAPQPALGGTATTAGGSTPWLAARASTGSWSTSELDGVSAKGAWVSPMTVLDAQGDVTAMWPVSDASGFVVRYALGDADGAPRIMNLTGSANAAPGQVLPFSGSADDFSPVTLTWDFGDRTTATGGSVQHAFATAGVRPVRFIATDEAGQSASRELTVGVALPPRVRPVPDTKITSPKTKAKRVKAIAGTAREPGGKVARVYVTVARKGGKAHKVRARGTTHWRLALEHRLAPGTYRITAYAVDSDGVKDPSPARRTVRVR